MANVKTGGLADCGLGIRAGQPGEIDRVTAFYDNLLDAMRDDPYCPRWQKDVYPSRGYLLNSLLKGELHIGECGNEFAAAMILNHDCNEGYSRVKWNILAPPERVMIVHVLAVLPVFARRGIAREMLAHALKLAADTGNLAVRLDVRKGTLPAQRLYESSGFVKVVETRLFYEPVEWTEFVLYEHPLALL